MTEPTTYTIRCAECGRTAQSSKPLNYWLCPDCKLRLEATPKKLLEHALKAAEANRKTQSASQTAETSTARNIERPQRHILKTAKPEQDTEQNREVKT